MLFLRFRLVVGSRESVLMLNFVLVISKTAVFKAITTYLRKRGTREEFLVGSVDESLRVYGCVCVCESQ